MTLFPGSIYGGISQLGASAKAAAIPWYLTGGISAANCIAAYQPKGAANYAASKVNLANPGTYNATDGAAYPTWDASGWSGVGASSQFLRTGVIPQINYSFIIRYETNSAYAGYTLGSYTSSTRFSFGAAPKWTDNKCYWNNGGFLGYSTPTLTGIMANSGKSCYLNGIYIGLTNAAFTGTSSLDVYIFATHNTATTAESFWTGKIQAVAIYNIALDATQIGLLTTAMAAL